MHTHRQVHLQLRTCATPCNTHVPVTKWPHTRNLCRARPIWAAQRSRLPCRSRMRDIKNSYVPSFALGEPIGGYCLGQVIESRTESLPEGTYVFGPGLKWQDIQVRQRHTHTHTRTHTHTHTWSRNLVASVQGCPVACEKTDLCMRACGMMGHSVCVCLCVCVCVCVCACSLCPAGCVCVCGSACCGRISV